MAMIIKGDMPKACNWFDENGKHRFCKVNAFCDCRTYTRGKRPSDCPIIGEIPDKHGRIVDISKVENSLTMWEDGELDYEPPLDEILSMIRYSTKTIVEATE